MDPEDSAAWPPYRERKAALRDVQERLKGEPDSLALRFELAGLLAALGHTLDARNAYIDLLSRDPSHCPALNQLGALLYGTGYRTAARTAFAEAVARHPDDAPSRVNLGSVLHDAGEFALAREQFEAALRLDPGSFDAHQGLAYALPELGDDAGAREHRRKGFEGRPVTSLPYRGSGPPVPLLLLISAAGGNIPIRHLLDDRVFQTYVLAPEFYDCSTPLPPHRVIFNAIGDADLDAPALAAAERVLALTTAKVINEPSAVRATGRADHGRLGRLVGLPGLVAPKTVTLPRAELANLASLGFRFPLLVRTPGFQTGRHFVRVENPEALAAAVAGLPGKQLTAIEFLDARAADGNVRKYRVMMLGGRLYPLHLAISSQWKVHYFTADMADRPEHRAEEAAFLEDMPRVLGPGAMRALAEVQTVLGLDYGGIDFGLNAAGEVLFFEANATMVVNPPEPDPRWDYRRPAVERVFAAVRAMLVPSPKGERSSPATIDR